MKWPRIDNRLLLPMELLALLVTALLTAWWGTVVVVALLRFLFFTSARALSLMTFASWAAVCVYRDFENLHGPTRIFAKLLSISKLGFPLDSDASRITVFIMIGLVGSALALLSATGVGALQHLLARQPADDTQ